MGLLRRPPVAVALRGASARRPSPACGTRGLPVLTPVVLHNHIARDAHLPTPSQHTVCDFGSFFRAELGDSVAPPGADALTTERATVMASPRTAALHPCHSSVWVPLLHTLRSRGALTAADRVAAQRFLSAATYADLLPWLWCDSARANADLTDSPQVDARPPLTATEATATTATARVVGESFAGEETGSDARRAHALAALRSAHPSRWAALIDDSMRPTTASTSTEGAAQAGAGLAHIQRWQEVFYALSCNAAFASSPEELAGAHTALLATIDRYYADCIAAQAAVPLPRCSPPAHAARGGARTRFTLTRMPPALLRQWRRLYRAQFALLDYAELLERVVQGEEGVVAAVRDQVRRALAHGGHPPSSFPQHVSSTLLDDGELLLFYLTIPGRRESGLAWEGQWRRTLDGAAFAMARIFRGQLTGAPQITAASGADVVARAVGVLMNVCMWVRNNNAEGARCLELTRVLLDTYLSVVDAVTAEDVEWHGAIGLTSAELDARAAAAWRVVEVIRQAALDSVLAKAARLHLACSTGLFDVATAATAVEVLRPGTDTAMNARDIHILLATSKPTVEEVWASAQTHPSGAAASRYGLVTVGLRLVGALVDASASHRLPRAALQRLGSALRAWTAQVGAPLRLTMESMEGLWLHQMRGPAARASDAVWADIFSTGGPPALPLAPAEDTEWTCGCGHTSPRQSAAMAVPACAACVLRTAAPHRWQCKSCGYTAATGDPVGFCLYCGSVHPALVDRPAPAVEHGDTGRGDALLFVCDDCQACTRLGGAEEDAGGVPSCTACGGASGRGYVRSAFQWSCGCGAVNSAVHRHCASCTRRRAEVVAEEEETRDRKLPESAPAIAERAPDDFAPAYRCPHCQQDVDVGAVVTGADFSVHCPHCHHPHPRQLAALTEGRRVHCPGCLAQLPRDAAACPHCGTGALSMLAPLLVSVADQPWSCHSCGHRSPGRVPAGSSASTVGGQCAACGTRRVLGPASEPGSCWECHTCGEVGIHARQCPRCLRPPPGLSMAELHVWRCTTCETTWNYSWQAVCALPGCGGRQAVAVEAAPPLPYAPWPCETCGAVNGTVHVGICGGCGEAARAEHLEAWTNTSSAVGAESAGAWLDRGLREQETYAPPAELTAAVVAVPPSRLTQVEALLLHAAEVVGGEALLVSPTAADTHPVMARAAATYPTPQRAAQELSSNDWEDGYARAVMGL